MDSLLCDEDWLTITPTVHNYTTTTTCMDSFYTCKEDCKNTLLICLQKESLYMPGPGYVDRLLSPELFLARVEAIQYFTQCCSRLNLASQTLFDAVNFFDRYVSMNQFDVCDEGFVELLSVACLSISSKFTEVSIPLLHELQMDVHLPYSFQPKKIQQMELEVLEALQWRLKCVTSYSYKELMLQFLDCDLQPQLKCTISSVVDELLLGALSDPKFIEFRPCIVALSALQCSIEEQLPSKSDTLLLNLVSLIPQDLKVDIVKCHKIMEERVADPIHTLSAYGYSYFPSSPVTVIPIQPIHAFNYSINLSTVSDSIVNFPSNPKKRKKTDDSL